MIEKNVASGINTTTVDASEITKVVFERSGVVIADFFHVRNDGDTTAYASVTDSTLTADADGVMSIPSGSAVTVGKGLQLYVLGEVTIVSTSIASNPFKVGAKGGDGGNGYTKTEVDERLSIPIINATTLTGEGTTLATADNVARIDMVGGKSVVSDEQLINVTPTSVTSSTGSSLSLEALTAKYFPNGMKSAGSVYDELNFTEMKAIQRIDTDGTALSTPIITPITENIDPTLDTVDGGTLTINVDNPVSGVPYKITEGYEYPIWAKYRALESRTNLYLFAKPLIPKMTSNTSEFGTASSNSEANFNGGNGRADLAYYAFDRNTATNVQYYSENKSDGWVQYEFAKPHTICKVEIICGNYSGSDSFDYYIQYFDGSEWVNCADVQNVSGVPSNLRFTNNVTFEPITTSKIRIISPDTKTSGHNFIIYDVQIFGE